MKSGRPIFTLRRSVLACMLLLVSVMSIPGADKPNTPVFVYASPSLENTIRVIAVTFKKTSGVPVEFVFGPASALQEKLQKGAPLDVVFTDDQKALDDLESAGLADKSTRAPIISAPLVLAAVPEKPLKVEMRKGYDLAKALKGDLAVVSLKAGPEGAFAKQAMEKYGWVEPMKGRLLVADDGKTAARAADHGKAAAALIYAPDISFTMVLEQVAVFPAESHDPILFSAALLKGAKPRSGDFISYLKTSAAQDLLVRGGFTALPAEPAK